MLIPLGYVGRGFELLSQVELDQGGLLLVLHIVKVMTVHRISSTMDLLIHGLIDLLLLFFAIFLLYHRSILLQLRSFTLQRPQLNLQHISRRLLSCCILFLVTAR